MTERRHEQHLKRSAYEPPIALLGGDAQPAAPAKRPLSTTLGAVFIVLRALTGALWLAAFALLWGDLADAVDVPSDEAGVVLAVVLVVGGVFIIALLLLGWMIWRGSNFARVVVMLGLTLSTGTAAISYFANGEEINIQTTLLTVACDIIVLLALSSRDARAWSRRSRTR